MTCHLKSLRLLSSDPDLVRTMPLQEVPGKSEIVVQKSNTNQHD